MTFRRYLGDHITKDLQSKIVLLGGPRQVGKTTFSKSLYASNQYLNFDIIRDRPIIMRGEWSKSVDLVILDELHKLKNWKSLLKGAFDDRGVRPRLIVTGSARLDTAKKMGDSLAGRHLYWKLHPLCCKELIGYDDPQVVMNSLMRLSGFPEPFFSGDQIFYQRWAKSHLDIILRQDLLDLESVSDIVGIETLLELLSHRVGQVTSYQSLANDLQRSATTVKRWIQVLENLFVIFRVTPWTKKVSRTLLKAPKFYFYDCARVQGDMGARFENLVATSLLKEVDFINDRYGQKLHLQYLRDAAKHELDFVVADNQRIYLAAEAKYRDGDFAPGFKAFSNSIAHFGAHAVQLVAELDQQRESKHGTRVVHAAKWLSELDLYSLTQRG
jgi:predicted AAA+ superfamily ATPase